MGIRLPLELILSVSEHSSQSVRYRLVQLDQNCYRAILPLLYRSIRLLEHRSLWQFCDTICLSAADLFEYPVALEISIRQVLDDDDTTATYALGFRSTLNKLHNLKYLVLGLPPMQAFQFILEPEGASKSFSLRSLRIPTWWADRSIGFITEQAKIEELEVPFIGEEDYGFPRASTDLYRDLPPHALPRLRYLAVGWSGDAEVVRGRPVSNIDIIRSPKPVDLTELGKDIRLASVPLTEFRISLGRLGEDINIDLDQFFSVFQFCQCSLLDLTIDLDAMSRLSVQHSEIGSPVDVPKLRSHLSRFAILKSFRIKGSRDEADWPERPASMIETLDRTEVEVWKEACPSLKWIYLFNMVLFG